MKKNDSKDAVELRPATAVVSEETWIDFNENELDETFEQDLSLLLLNSQADKQQADGIKTLRDLIKSSDNVVLPEDGRIYEALHDRIMAAVADKQPGTAVREEDFKNVSFLSRFTRKQAAAGASLMSIAIAMFAWFGMQSTQTANQDAVVAQVKSINAENEAAILAESARSSDSINDEVLMVVGEDEFVADAAMQKIAAMSDQDYAALLRDLRN